MNRKTVYVKDGGKYAAQQKLVYAFFPSGTEKVAPVTITFLGETIEKRLLKNSGGQFELLLSDVLDAIKANVYAFKPFNDFALDAFKPLNISYFGGTSQIDISVINAIDSPDSFLNSGDFMSRNTEIQFDERFEQGFHFYGTVEVARETTDGPDTLTIGQADELNFVSFRELLRLPSTPVVSYYNGTTTNAIQGETATYEATADNLTGNAGSIEVSIDFGGTIGTDSQIVAFAGNELGKVIQFTKLIPADEGTPRTAEITDSLGTTPYSWQYDIVQVLTLNVSVPNNDNYTLQILPALTNGLLVDVGSGYVAQNSGAMSIPLTTSTTQIKIKEGALLFNSVQKFNLDGYTLPISGVLNLENCSNIEQFRLDRLNGYSNNITELYLKSPYMTDVYARGLTNLVKISFLVDEFDGKIEHADLPLMTDYVFKENMLLSNSVDFSMIRTAVTNFTGFKNTANHPYRLDSYDNPNNSIISHNFTNLDLRIYAYNCNMLAADVDNLIIATEASATLNNAQNKTLKIDGTNAAPTAAGAAAIAALQVLGWTVTTS